MFRFTIRDVLWLTALAAMAVAWWVDRTHLVAAKAATENDVRDVFRIYDPFRTDLSHERHDELVRKYFPKNRPDPNSLTLP